MSELIMQINVCFIIRVVLLTLLILMIVNVIKRCIKIREIQQRMDNVINMEAGSSNVPL